jgi:hypothetical protein
VQQKQSKNVFLLTCPCKNAFGFVNFECYLSWDKDDVQQNKNSQKMYFYLHVHVTHPFGFVNFECWISWDKDDVQQKQSKNVFLFTCNSRIRVRVPTCTCILLLDEGILRIAKIIETGATVFNWFLHQKLLGNR